MDNKKKVGLIVTIVTIFLCACPGLCLIVFGATASYNAAFDDLGVNPMAIVIPLICIGVLGILISIGAGIYTLVQNRKDKQVEEITDIPDPLSGE